MKRWIPWLITGAFAAWLIASLPPRPEPGFHLRQFGELPALLNGRVQPLDSVGRNALLQMRSTQTVGVDEPAGAGASSSSRRMSAIEWLIEVMMRPERADDRRIFLIHHPDLLGELNLQGKGIEHSGLHYYSFNELRPALEIVQKQADPLLESESLHKSEPQSRTPFQQQLMKLHFALGLYNRLKNSLRPEGSDDFAAELDRFGQTMQAGVTAARKQKAGEDYNHEDFDRLIEFATGYDFVSRVAYPWVIPPPHLEKSRDDWANIGASLMESIHSGQIQPAAKFYAAMVTAYRQSKPEAFNLALADYRQWLSERFVPELSKSRREAFFNRFEPFYKTMVMYVFVFLLASLSWLNWAQWLNRSAFYLAVLGFIVHTFGLVFRMILEGRPPVTNLYSSAVFIGWGAVLLGIILERVYRDGIGLVTAGTIGFVTQLIAHHLSLDGDTMEMLRAVLDTNFWLATHVVAVTTGYASTFVAGFLGILYILRGSLTRSLTEKTAKSLSRMIYGIVCFATLFSFVGTVLGGIWADQSWGRFWGWDPKENGALIIVIWNATILHARWGGLVRERGLANMAVFGNIVTSFSWFGVNMLNIGLHSYGFIDKAVFWLALFVSSQVAIILLGMVPLRYWLSNSTHKDDNVRDKGLLTPTSGHPRPSPAAEL